MHGAVLLCVSRYDEYTERQYVDIEKPNILAARCMPYRLLERRASNTSLAVGLPQAKKDTFPIIIYVSKPTPHRDLKLGAVAPSFRRSLKVKHALPFDSFARNVVTVTTASLNPTKFSWPHPARRQHSRRDRVVLLSFGKRPSR